MAGFWKRLFARYVNVFSFWAVVILVAVLLVVAARAANPPAPNDATPKTPAGARP